MKRLWLNLVFALSVLQGEAFAAEDDYRSNLFDLKRKPTEALLKRLGPNLIREPIEGVDIPMAMLDKQKKWRLLDQSACIIVGFRISAQGTTDKFIVLDSQPKDLLAPATLGAISEWRFKPADSPIWMILPVHFSLYSEAKCVEPIRKKDVILPDGCQHPQLHDPVYPTADLLRTRGAGCATIAYRVGPDGKTRDLELLDAKPDDSFVDVAAADLETWRFDPETMTLLTPTKVGFARFGYGTRDGTTAIPECMTVEFAREHYQPSEQTP